MSARCRWLRAAAWVAAALLCAPAVLAGEAACGAHGVAVQVLGSGGPIADDARASSGYLVWLDGRARVLVDAGGGVFVRFGAAGAALDDLDLIALTHLHTDHSADLPALLKGAAFSARTRPLPVSGPTGAGPFPGLEAFMHALFDGRTGAYRYLSGVLDGGGGLFETPRIEVDAAARKPRTILERDGLRVEAVGVRHGIVPALAYQVQIGAYRIAFSGDQNDDNPHMAPWIRGADVLVMDHAIPQDADRVARALHATPEGIGRLAARAKVETLVLSHWMRRSLDAREDSLRRIREWYDGRIVEADDLMCVPVPM